MNPRNRSPGDMEIRKQWQKIKYKSKPTIYVDQNGLVYKKHELKNLSYYVKKINKYNQEYGNEITKERIVEIEVEAVQGELF